MPGSPAFAYRVPLRPVETPLYLDIGLGRTDPPPIRSLRASVKLDVFGANDALQVVEFRVDTGAGMSLMSLTRAEALGLPTDGRRGQLKLTTANEE